LNEKTYIEFRLLDEDSKAIPQEQYEIMLPDGTTLNGKLDNNGFIRIDGIVRGRCKIKFPHFGYMQVL
jgi:cytoskeletal protein CcmA (bactofilin family)